MPPPPDAFAAVFFFVSRTLDPTRRTELTDTLAAAGATAVPLADARLTHLITASLPTDDALEVLPEGSSASLVTPTWAERSRVLGAPLAAEHFSPDPAMLFSGVTASAADLGQADTELLSAAITALGGQWRTALTKDVTHLFALAPGGQKYATAMHYRAQVGMRVLVPHWFDDSVRLGIRDLPTRDYEWPEPIVFKSGVELEKQEREYSIPEEKRAFYETALATGNDLPFVRAPAKNVWDGKRVLISASLQLSPSQRSAHEDDIRRGGGVPVPLTLVNMKGMSPREIAMEEAEKIDETDVLVTRYRAGPAYVKAYKTNKTIGSLAWLWCVRASGALSRPTDQLLHYPIPRKPIEGFDKHVITITNYTGKHREYIKKLICVMGAQFTPSMSNKNTILVAAYIGGTKTTKAAAWSIPIVHHLWLEDCFAQWRALTPAHARYIGFAPGVDYSSLLSGAGRGMGVGGAGVGGAGFSEEELKALEEDFGEEEEEEEEEGAEIPQGSAASLREVEEAVSGIHHGIQGLVVADVSAGGYLDVDGDFEMRSVREEVSREEVSRMMDEEDVEDAEEEERLRKVTAVKVKTKVGREDRKGKGKARATAESSDEDDGREASKRQPTKTRTSTVAEAATKARRASKRYGRRAREEQSDAHSELEYEYEDEDEAPSKAKDKGKSKAKQAEKTTGRAPGAKAAAAAKPSAKGKRKSLHQEEDMEHEEDEPVDGRTKTTWGGKGKGKTATAFASKGQSSNGKKPKAAVSDTDEEGQQKGSEEEEEREGPNTPSRSAAPAKGRTPKRRLSVVLPTAAAVYSPSKSAAGPSASQSDMTKGKGGPHTHSQRTNAKEAVMPSPKKAAGKPQASADLESESDMDSPLSPPPVRQARRSDASAAVSKEPALTAVAGPSGREPSPTSATTSTRGRRSAANKATQRLHEEIMPDVMNFEKEMKRGSVRHMWEEEKEKTKEQKAEKTKAKKRTSAAMEELQSEGEEPGRKKKRLSEGRKDGRRLSTNRQNEESEEGEESDGGKNEPREKGAAKGKGAAAIAGNKANSKAAQNVRVLTTQVTVSDEVIKALTKLGVKMTIKPSECTHLVAKSIVRTEKFLCAMAVAPFILSEKWLVASAAAKTLLPEDKFFLTDPATEKKWDFKLSDALQRSKETGGKVFKGMSFYVTPKVGIDTKLLKNVITAGGGQLLNQTPTLRVLNGHDSRFVISSPADVSIWRPLAQSGYPIYTQELILDGALTQEIDWESPSNRVEGSISS